MQQRLDDKRKKTTSVTNLFSKKVSNLFSWSDLDCKPKKIIQSENQSDEIKQYFFFLNTIQIFTHYPKKQ